MKEVGYIITVHTLVLGQKWVIHVTCMSLECQHMAAA